MRAKVKSLRFFYGLFSKYELIVTEKPSETRGQHAEVTVQGKSRGSRTNGMCDYSVWRATQTVNLRPFTDTSPSLEGGWNTRFKGYQYVDTDEVIHGTLSGYRLAKYYRSCNSTGYAFVGRTNAWADSMAAHCLIEDGSGAFALGTISGPTMEIFVSTSDPQSPVRQLVHEALWGPWSPSQCKARFDELKAKTGAHFAYAQPVVIDWDSVDDTMDFEWPDAPTEESVRERCDYIRHQADELSRFRDGLLGADLINGFTALPDVDNIENATQLSSLGRSLFEILNPKQLAEGIVSRNPKVVAKALSNKHLAYKYGDRLTIKDAHEMHNAFRRWSAHKNGSQTRRAQMVEKLTDNLQVTHRIVIKAQRYNDAASRLLLGAADLGVLPDLNTVWNLIPLSFVVEWFVNVTDALEATKAITLRNCFMPLSRYDSKRIEYRQETDTSSFVYEAYEGVSSPNPSFPYPDFDIKVEAPGERELVTGECLLVQRFVKG